VGRRLAAGELPLLDGAEGMRVGAPLARPGAVVCVGLNYAAHAAESGVEPPKQPVIFLKTPNTVGGPDDDVRIPLRSSKTDWEVELGVVIGRPASYLASPEESLGCVAGFVLTNDVSERTFQLEESGGQWSKGKCCPGFTPTGPWLVTPDEFADKDDLAISCSLSDEGMQSSRTSMMLYDVPELLVRLSAVCPLLPGDIIFSGTPSGIGNRRTPQRFIGPDDVLVSEIEGIGTLTTRFTAGG
jgi:2-keto-4-pentenoate hydratase/2-oxohepta-3-ene-1,7-dioic acid hydratase in catechol pathway